MTAAGVGDAAPAGGEERGPPPPVSVRPYEPENDVDLLRRYLLGRDVECPGCGYNLRGLTGAACPECNEPLALRVSLSEPRSGPFIAGLIGLACGAGAFALMAAWVGIMTMLHGPAPSTSIYVVPVAGLAVEGPAVWLWISQRGRRWLRSLAPTRRTWAAAACWMATLLLFGLCIAAFSAV